MAASGLVLLAACTSTTGGSGTAASSVSRVSPAPSSRQPDFGSGTATQPTGAPSVPSSSRGTGFADVLARIGLHDGDLSQGLTVKVVPGGTTVKGQASMTNCGYDFTTEHYRVARRAVEVYRNDQEAGLGNEVVAYDTAEHAAAALAQWIKAAETCPSEPVPSKEQGVPPTRYEIGNISKDESALPARDNVTIEERITSGSQQLYSASTVQVHGRYLSSVYAYDGVPLSTPALHAVSELSVQTGQRLLAE